MCKWCFLIGYFFVNLLFVPSRLFIYRHLGRKGNFLFINHSRPNFHNLRRTILTYLMSDSTSGLQTTETWVVTLTALNLVSVGLVFHLVLLDNRHTGMSNWKLLPESRTPIYLVGSIFVSNIIFCVREVQGMIILKTETNGETKSVIGRNCAAFNEISWWGIPSLLFPLLMKIIGIWFPIVALTLRFCFIAGGIIFKVLSHILTLSLIK